MMAMARPTILVVEDDLSLREALCERLARHGFMVVPAADTVTATRLLASRRPDLIVLDVMLPGEDGLSWCRRLPTGAPPVLMLSALGDTADRIVGLELGAADYLRKPFDARELIARIRAILRRPTTPSSVDSDGGRLGKQRVIAFEGWRFEPDEQRLLAPSGERVQLTASESALLRAFVLRPGRLLSRHRLLDLTRGQDADMNDRAIDLAVSRLRKRLLEAGGADPIETVRGAGYRFRAETDALP